MTLHYFSDGTCQLMFAKDKEQYSVPVMMVLKVCRSSWLSFPIWVSRHCMQCLTLCFCQALLDVPDVKIFAAILQVCHGDTLVKGCMETMLRDLLIQGLTDQAKLRKYIGESITTCEALKCCKRH